MEEHPPPLRSIMLEHVVDTTTVVRQATMSSSHDSQHESHVGCRMRGQIRAKLSPNISFLKDLAEEGAEDTNGLSTGCIVVIIVASGLVLVAIVVVLVMVGVVGCPHDLRTSTSGRDSSMFSKTLQVSIV